MPVAIPLSTLDHDRDSAGLLYVYPVISRRAGGVSVGINLNPNDACNWRCVYCQVPGLVRGSAPPLDLARLEGELRGFLRELVEEDFMTRRVPAGLRQIRDLAFSGNGEPTSAAEFADAVILTRRVAEEFGLMHTTPLRLITNGSLAHRPGVQAGLRELAAGDGEVWFKLDAATAAGRARLNDVHLSDAQVERNLRACAALCPTWLQTCRFAFDGEPPAEAEDAAYLALLRRLRADGVPLAGVLLYGLARPSQQPEAPRLRALPEADLEAFADRVRALGVIVRVSV